LADDLSNPLPSSSLTHWASENEKLLAQKENLLVQNNGITLFTSPVLGKTLYSPSASLHAVVLMGTGKFYAGGNPVME